MALKDIVDVEITADLPGVTRQGFGLLLILSAHTRYPDRIRQYADPSGLLADGFLVTDPEYVAVQRAFQQEPRPARVGLARRERVPTMHWTITPAPFNATRYNMTVAGRAVSVLSDANATAPEIALLLKTAIDLFALPLTTAVVGNTLTITANVAGAWFQVAVENEQRLALMQDQVDPGVAADLAELQLLSNDWYAFQLLTASKAELVAAAAWNEANGKLFSAYTQDADVLTNGAGNVALALRTASYFRTVPSYHADNGAHFATGVFGQLLPMDPGSETWAFKLIRGVTPSALTEQQQLNLKLNNVLHYVSVGGQGITLEGKTSAGEWIDVIRFRDWLIARIQERVVDVKRRRRKVPYTDAGVTGLAGEVRAQLQEGETAGGLDPARPFTITQARVADQPKADRDARVYRGIRFSANLAGAIHATKISGSVTA